MNATCEHLYYEEINEIGYLYLNGPHGNKMSKEFLDELCSVFENNIIPANIRGIIIQSKGKHFSSGANVDQLIENVGIKSIHNGEMLALPYWVIHIKEIFNAVSQMDIPIVTGVSGFCIGSGLELALVGNIRICAEGAVIGFPESTFGLLPGATGSYRSMEIIGMSKSMELVLSGSFIDCDSALQMGLFHKKCNKKEIHEVCEREMQEILKNK